MTHDTREVEDCPFCDTSRIKSVVNDYGDVIAFEPLNPVVKGHLLVVPKKHITDFTKDIDVTARVMQQAARIAGNLGGSYNLITSKGREATQSVFHLHVHLVPRTEGDNLTLPWTNIHHQLQKAREEALAEYKQFVLNVLDGIDIADGQCNTKAIRFALQTRAINAELNQNTSNK